ncbi:MAG: DNA polymerase [Phycisphaerae bacterium]|jgi:DNA polymerase-4
MPLRVLFVDMNAFFASVEQQLRPELRGRPVAVAAVDVDSTCCIAVSYEAKALGIQRGMSVGQARTRGPLTVVVARPAVYVQVHHAITDAVNTCLPIESIDSIDEMTCRLGSNQREPAVALELARRVKQAIYRQVGCCLRCSIGLAPNRLLAKVAAEMKKPDGLVLINDQDLPQVLYPLALDDLPGIGPRMLRRLHSAGVTTVEGLCRLSESRMRTIWNGVVGERWWHWLRGHDLPATPTHRSTVGHSHVLPPKLRTDEGARTVLLRLIHKAATRLRRINYWAGRLEVCVVYAFRGTGWSGSVVLGSCQDTLTMIEAFQTLWRCRPRGGAPLRVAVTLYDLVPAASAALPLFPAEQCRVNLSRAMDRVNARFGLNAVYFGCIHDVRDTAPTRIAFTQIPDFDD